MQRRRVCKKLWPSLRVCRLGSERAHLQSIGSRMQTKCVVMISCFRPLSVDRAGRAASSMVKPWLCDEQRKGCLPSRRCEEGEICGERNVAAEQQALRHGVLDNTRRRLCALRRRVCSVLVHPARGGQCPLPVPGLTLHALALAAWTPWMPSVLTACSEGTCDSTRGYAGAHAARGMPGNRQRAPPEDTPDQQVQHTACRRRKVQCRRRMLSATP